MAYGHRDFTFNVGAAWGRPQQQSHARVGAAPIVFPHVRRHYLRTLGVWTSGPLPDGMLDFGKSRRERVLWPLVKVQDHAC